LQDASGAFVEPARARLVELRLTAAEELADIELTLGRAGAVAHELAALVDAHPLRERLRARYMAALFHSGRQNEALQTYRAYRDLLADKEGLDPGREISELETAILRGDPRLSQPQHVVPAQLPLAPHGFAGRRTPLARLDALAADPGQSAAVLIISGTPGVGKTTLAVQWAHRMAPKFPDGQLYVNLRGFDPGASVMTPGEAIRGLLEAMGVAPERIPAGLAAQSALYRSLLDGQRVLVLLDNARDAAQVRPLLPGAPGCLAVVTSRSQLASLIVAEGARPITLDLLDPTEATDLVGRRIGQRRTTAEPEAVARILDATARLPLALALVAARAVMEPRLTLSALAAELAGTDGGLDALRSEDESTDVRAVFSWSLRAVSPDAARLFRLLGVHPGADITAPAAASLAGATVGEVATLLDELTLAHLVAEHVPGRYRSHDLLRAYAVELSEAPEHTPERAAAQQRVLNHYLYTASTAAPLITPNREENPLAPVPDRVTPEHPRDRDAAWAWYSAEQQVLVAAVRRAADEGFDGYTWRLAAVVSDFLDRQGRWDEVVSANLAALEAATRLGEVRAAAHAHRLLGNGYARRARYDDAYPHIQQAIDLFGQIGDHARIASAHRLYAFALERQGRHAEGLEHARRSLELYQVAGDRVGEANVINNLGWFHGQLGNYELSLKLSRKALDQLVELGHRDGQAAAWDTIGFAYHHLGDHDRAIECHQRTLEILREVGHRFHEAETSSHLGDAYLAAGKTDEARAAFTDALEIFVEADLPAATAVRGKLEALVEPAIPAVDPGN
jgi:tetratricopeptide (TPR) repeat protein